MKKLFSLLLTAILMFTACSEKGNTSQQSSGEIDWPTKTVTITVPYNAGGDTDTYARLMARKLEEKFGQTFVIVNMTGGSGIVAAKTIMAEKPDGYNILFNHTGASLVQEATGTADFSYTDDFTNVATIAQDNTYVLVAKKGKWENLKAMIADAKANPGKIRYSQVHGSVTHYVASKLEDTMGIKLNKLDVGTGAAERLAAFMGDQVDLLAVNYINIKDYVEKGDFIILGVFANERNKGMEDFPTFKEQGYDIVSSKNYEIKFPKGADEKMVQKLSQAIKEITEDKEFVEQLKKYYAIPFYRDAETTSKEDKEEVARLKEYFK
ncbi:tripartite tricarboxylate transporter substrate binding protein [Fusobacterium nucleatum]|uniref:Tripartite tricarboxylate transporter substrate binding protein n=1 Tax=Fusobacterium nucleatum TaxID=851 RepID=A0A2N6TEW4_FUSNU|nr:tripartite tricarboxylate transporter substrate binding protein [Fusobacterium nucleatum]PMC67844.1 tripartite tricarboxylate transporter substrate binding protein [Fusobacterium nucleatum]